MLQAGQLQQPATQSSLSKDMVRLNERLERLLSQLCSLSDHLHGARPRDVAPTQAPTGKDQALAYSLNEAHVMLGRAEDELQYIESRL
jgi:hypothetical protein